LGWLIREYVCFSVGLHAVHRLTYKPSDALSHALSDSLPHRLTYKPSDALSHALSDAASDAD
jgi:hypothetical protein